ncbi:esterase FE4-like isoform X2 [Aricia agestis]|nr:esterase FE4-like isoform X2 [Aricia agestis]XP_041972173.1 esterase FE4-like isoform X2 [Aricia agestis]
MTTLVLVFLVLCKLVAAEEYLDVTIDQGPVRGYKTSDGVFAFYGIHYATAPTGPQRFNAPLPPPTWEDTFEATERLIICPQAARGGGQFMKTVEDCLVTNIYVPDTDEKNLPVVVFFHGGAYQYGYGESKEPQKIVKTKKVIALNFNYRVGPNGFLCLGTKDVPGNAAMKDQVALLRWVQQNIKYFGGNPADVTIAGCSAGGSSVDLHLVSKMSRGLFKKAIPESSANLCSYSVQPDPIEYAQNYAKLLNFTNVDDIQALEEFYKNVPFSVLNSINVMENLDSSVTFVPCIERDLGQEMFLDTDPSYVLKTGAYRKVPMLYGFTDMEGMLRLSFFPTWKGLMNENFADFLPENLQFQSEEEKQRVARKVKNFYFGNRTVDESTIANFVDYITDITFTHGMLKSAALQTKAGNNNVYLYEYVFDKSGNLPYNLHGANHCDQSMAVLDEANEEDLSAEYKQMKSTMRDLWLNFILTGKPVPAESSYPQWPPANTNRSPHMVLNTTMELKGKLQPKRAKFWDNIYSKYYRKPIPPTY